MAILLHQSAPKRRRLKNGTIDQLRHVPEIYPHFRGRSDKAKSLTAWKRLSGEEQTQLSRAIDAFRATPNATKDGGRYVKAFDRWITGEQWRDFLSAETPSSAEPSKPIDWALRLSLWREHDAWPTYWGEKPGREGCQVPRELLDKEGLGAR